MILKNLWSISSLMLTGISIIVPTVLATSCVGKKAQTEPKEWIFNSYSSVMQYIEKHKQNPSQPHTFSSQSNQPDHEFVKKNMNLNLLINSSLWISFIAADENTPKEIKLHIENDATAQVSAKTLNATASSTIRWANDVIEILVADNRNDPILISYDFNLPCALEHYIAGGWALVPQAIQTEWARYIYFHNPSPRFSFKVFLSPSDWIDTRIVFPIES